MTGAAPGLLLAACLVASLQCVSPNGTPAPAAGALAEASPASPDPAKPVLNELVSGPDVVAPPAPGDSLKDGDATSNRSISGGDSGPGPAVPLPARLEHADDNLVRASVQPQRIDGPEEADSRQRDSTSAPGDANSTIGPSPYKRRPIKKANLTSASPEEPEASSERLGRLVSSERDANNALLAARSAQQQQQQGDDDGTTKRPPRVRISVRRQRLNTTEPPLPPDPAVPQPPATKESAWRPMPVESNGLTTERWVPASTPPPLADDKLPSSNTIKASVRRRVGERDETLELSSVSPLQRTRLTTLRWRHEPAQEDVTTTEVTPPRRVRHRETPPTPTNRPLVRRGSVRFGTTTPPPTQTSFAPVPAPVWPGPVPPTLPPVVIEVSTLPDTATSFAVVPEVVMSNEEARVQSDLADKKANLMLDLDPHLPLEKVFSTTSSPERLRPLKADVAPAPAPAVAHDTSTSNPPTTPTTSLANKTLENLVKPVLGPDNPVVATPSTAEELRPAPAKVATQDTNLEKDGDIEEAAVKTNAPNIHVVDPPNLVTVPVGRVPPAAPASSSTRPTTTAAVATVPDVTSESNRWRPVQPAQPPFPQRSSSYPTTTVPTATSPLTTLPTTPSATSTASSSSLPPSSSESPYMEYQTFPPGYGTAHSAASAPSAPDFFDEDFVTSAKTPLDGGGLEAAGGPTTTPMTDVEEEDDRDEDLGPAVMIPVTSIRMSTTSSPTSPVTDKEEEDSFDMPTGSPSPQPHPSSSYPPSISTTKFVNFLPTLSPSTTIAQPPSPSPTSKGETVDFLPGNATSTSTTPSTTTPQVTTTTGNASSSSSTRSSFDPTPITTTSASNSSSTTTTASSPLSTSTSSTPHLSSSGTTTTPSAPTEEEVTPKVSSTTTPGPTPAVEPSLEESPNSAEDDIDTSTIGEAGPGPVEEVPVPEQEPVPAYLRLLMETTWRQFCVEADAFRAAAATLISNGTNMPVQPRQVVLLNPNAARCAELADEARNEEVTTTEANIDAGDLSNMISVQIFIADAGLHFSKNLTEDFLRFWGCRGLEFPIRKVDLVLQSLVGSDGGSQGSGAGVIAAIAISCVAAACLLLLAALLLIMRKRQKSLSYGQRCTPVSLDAYSLDSVSVCNSSSVRRKGARASKRSYGNPAFSDPAAPSHPLTFPALSNFSTDRAALEAEFSAIPQVAPKADELPAGADTKNRYANVIPLPETRVTLSCKDGDPLSQYINANYVRGPKSAEKFYIACQAPLPSTVEDFWRMVWETQAKVILMLTDLVEDGVEKCAEYLPPSEVTDCHRLFGDFQVTLKKREVKDKYVVSSIQLKNMETNLWREATHLWFVGWPSKGVPDDPSAIIAFLIEARAFMRSPGSGSASAGTAPHIVHCSPGTGRTGTVLAIDLSVREFETTRQVDIPRTVYRLRKDRAGCVQTKEQYVFIYKVLNLYATKLTGGALDSI